MTGRLKDHARQPGAVFTFWAIRATLKPYIRGMSKMRFNEHEPLFGGKLRFLLDFRVIAAVLLVVIAVMLLIWKPWSGGTANNRTIEVRGESTISATPDEFVFYPSYEFKSADKAAALAELSKKSDELVTKLKELGVTERDIKTNSTAYDDKSIRPMETAANTLVLGLTITVTDESLVQKVQDYLVGTAPAGTVSPQASFSDEKRKALERAARSAAISEAKSKADQTARELGFKVGKVKNVSDGAGFSTLPDQPAEALTRSSDDSAISHSGASLGVYPGENELPYAVTVVYFIR